MKKNSKTKGPRREVGGPRSDYDEVRIKGRGGGSCLFAGPWIILPTHLRRERLLATKLMSCDCPRCKGPDFSRQIPCPDRIVPIFERERVPPSMANKLRAVPF